MPKKDVGIFESFQGDSNKNKKTGEPATDKDGLEAKPSSL